MGRIKQYFVDQGLTPADIPKAFIFHEVISVAFAAFTWSTCYAIQPSVTLMTPLSKLPIASKAAGAFDKALAFSDKKVASMGWLKKVPLVKNAAPRRLTVSLAESLMFRGAVKPITFGGKLYLSYQFVMWGKDRARQKAEKIGKDVADGKRKKKSKRSEPASLTLSTSTPGGLVTA
jgi:hypothetical protein